MIKNNYEVRAQKFIKEFAPYLKGIRVSKNNLYKIQSAVRQFNVDKKRNVKVSSGVSRVVLITSDYVIKLDLGTTWAGNSKSEMRAYVHAQSLGFEHLLAKITHYKHKNRNFYIMPRVKVAYDLRYETRNRLYVSLSDEEKNYLRENIDDMHDANWGSLNGEFIVIDYAWNDFK